MVSTFVLWGLWHGLWSCVETALHLPKKLERKWYGHVYTLLVVIFGFALFRAASPAQGFALWRAMLTGFHADNVCRAALSAALDARNLVLCVLALVLCMPAAPALRAKLERLRCAAALRGALALLLFLLCLMTLAANSFQPFIYASF